MQRGFTLIETLVYIGLFALIISGLLFSTFNVFQTSDRTKTRAAVQEEGDFLLGKLNWALSGASAVSAPASGGTGTTLTLTKAGSSISFALSSGNLTLQRGVGAATRLNNTNSTITAATLFTHTGSGGSPEFVTAAFTLQTKTPNGLSYSQDFQTTKYLRK
jgi:type II secretory pathway pseudopilin PulG